MPIKCQLCSNEVAKLCKIEVSFLTFPVVEPINDVKACESCTEFVKAVVDDIFTAQSPSTIELTHNDVQVVSYQF